jgi:hypothetical protein
VGFLIDTNILSELRKVMDVDQTAPAQAALLNAIGAVHA